MSWLGSDRYGAPILESLELETSYGLGSIPSPFVAFPSLRELTLKGVLLPKGCSAYIGLRKLHFEYSGRSEKQLHLRSLLTACPDLEELTIRSMELWHVFEDMDVSGDPKEDPVQMPHLSSVTLELFARDLYRILFLMALPPTARIQLRIVRHSKSEKTAFSDILPLDPRCIPSLRHACKLRIRRGYPPRFVVSRIRYTVDDKTPMIDDEPFLDIEPTHYSSLSKINSMVNLLQHLPHVHHIDFIDCYDNSADHLALARMLPLVRSLHIRSLTLEYLRTWTAQIKHSPNPLWPHLRHLVLSWTNLEGDCEDLVTFCQALRTQIQTIDLRKCRMSSLEQENILLEKLRGLGIPSVTCIDSRYPDPH
ncbi:hypothetical protein QCA50_007722 [Cerrena zonata]|uniref:Uncharacterized protein n=1 Tax=Cerrena zonata TaxID=2478898 RepID=A0AAW0G6R2_9APHY